MVKRRMRLLRRSRRRNRKKKEGGEKGGESEEKGRGSIAPLCPLKRVGVKGEEKYEGRENPANY